jgi:uncharacterized protein (TIGR03067 family)
MRCALSVMVMIVCSIVPVGCSRSAIKGNSMTDFNSMQGAWDVQKLEQDGEPAADAPLLKMVIIQEDKFAFRYFLPRSKKNGDLVDRFGLDASQNPKQIQLISPEDGSVHRGIYELGTDTLKICWSRAAQSNPPTDFSTSKGSGRRLVVLKRAQRKLQQ